MASRLLVDVAEVNGTLDACSTEALEDGGNSLWYVGVVMSIFASILSNLGLNFQKHSLNLELEKESSERRGYFRQPWWAIGMGMVIAGSLGDFWALSYAAQSLIVPVGGFTLVANVFFASQWLGENLSRKDLFATAMIIVGIVLVAGFADKSSQCFTLDDLIALYQETRFIIYAVFLFGGILALYFFARYVKKLEVVHGKDSSRYQKYAAVHPIAVAGLSGILGAQSTLFAKSTAELLKLSFNGDNQMDRFLTWVLVGLMLFCIFSQTHWLATALSDFDAVVVVPIFQCFFITGAILSGAVYFNEFAKFTLIQAIMFPLGVAVTVLGVILLSKGHDDGEDHIEMESPPPSPGIKPNGAADEEHNRDASGEIESAHPPGTSRAASRNTIAGSIWQPPSFLMVKQQFENQPEMAPPILPSFFAPEDQMPDLFAHVDSLHQRVRGRRRGSMGEAVLSNTAARRASSKDDKDSSFTKSDLDVVRKSVRIQRENSSDGGGLALGGLHRSVSSHRATISMGCGLSANLAGSPDWLPPRQASIEFSKELIEEGREEGATATDGGGNDDGGGDNDDGGGGNDDAAKTSSISVAVDEGDEDDAAAAAAALIEVAYNQ